jgi:hypothetical protein
VQGFVASSARPARNITGFTNIDLSVVHTNRLLPYQPSHISLRRSHTGTNKTNQDVIEGHGALSGRPVWITPGVGGCHGTTSLFPVLTQAEEREDEQDHDDQTDEINQSIHYAAP